MPEKRWLLGLGPPIGALGALGALALFASVSAGGAAGRWAPPPCGPGMTLQAAAAETPTERADGGETWYRLDPSLDDKGELAGQRLTIGRRGGRSRLLDLPPESFVAGPFGGVVLVGSDDGQISRLAAIDVPAGCSWSLDRQTSVVRRATLAPDREAIYEFRVDRTTRADLGVWRQPISGSSATRALEPIPADPGFGPTFTTELSWALDGARLVAQSCGASACRTRVLEPATSRVIMSGDRDQGELIGVAGGVAVVYDAGCRGLPCPIRGIDLANGSSRLLAPGAGLARLLSTKMGPRLLHEFRADGHIALRVVTLTGSQERALGAPAGVRLVPNPARSGSAIGSLNARFVLAPQGRIGLDPAAELHGDLDGTTTIAGFGGSR